MFALSPIIRLSFGLVLLTTSILSVSHMIGLLPDNRQAELEARKVIAETLAVQLSSQVSEQEIRTVSETLKAVVERNTSVLSAALRRQDGNIAAEAGGHVRHWAVSTGDRSNATHVQVPIYNGNTHWGTVEIRFSPLGETQSPLRNSFTAVLAFVGIVGFLTYVLFLRHALRELDPRSVIPERVRAALDVLAEGLLLVDLKERIVLANAAFARKLGQPPDVLLGRKASELGWEPPVDDDADAEWPWLQAIRGGDVPTGAQLRLRTALKEVYTFTVNAAPITGPEGKVRGALATFDDVTELERKNEDLKGTLKQLEHSQREITRQNRELQALATRDPLTSCLNRRALSDAFKMLFREAYEDSAELGCIMVDIDRFKSINDRYGHATGDKVIKLVAEILTETVRASDLVGRYGGEEFCVVLPGTDIEQAHAIAERMRAAIQEGRGAKFTSAVRITASFGVSGTAHGARDPGELVNQADKALYVAKESGRNRVVRWSPDLDVRQEQDTTMPEVAGAATTGVLSRDEVIPVPPDVSNLAAQAEGGDRSETFESLLKRVQELEQALRESEQERERVLTDAITGLPNRELLFDRIGQGLDRARRYGTKLAVLVLGIDVLQQINSTLGHAAGEKFIKTAASWLRGILRQTDTVAILNREHMTLTVSRLSNDEFGVLLTDLKHVESITWVVKRILGTLDEPVVLEGNEIYISTSIGVSVFPLDGEEPDTLVRNATAAMRAAKQTLGQNNYRFYSSDMNQQSKEHLRLESQLRRAIERGEFVLHYQPKIELKSGQMISMEALLRWQHPQRGLLLPNAFITVAEQTGIIEPIGDWVVRSACHQVKMWRDAGYDDISVAVNLSPIQFRHQDLAARIAALVEETGLPPSTLEIEITETAIMQNVDTAVTIMEELHRAGVRLSMDDFGTGYSSLSSLRRFPLDQVKIDRSFLTHLTENPHDFMIVSAIIAMAHSLGLRVVAEGVETEAQLWLLHDLACDEVQGYLFSTPVSREAATELLANQAQGRGKLREGAWSRRETGRAAALVQPTRLLGILNEVSGVSANRMV
jgi:diguanylate cyclase (GGDEF)-like protein/PAS domain S-box-containing protein